MILAAAILSFFFFLFYSYKTKNWPNWPVVGKMPSLVLTVHRYHASLAECLQANKGAVMVPLGWFWNTDIFYTADPEDIRHVMQTHADNYVKGDLWRQRFDVFGNSSFNLDVEESKVHRNLGRSFFSHPQFLRLLVKTFRGSVDNLATILRDASKKRTTIDLKDCLQKQMFHATCGAFAGCEQPGKTYGERFSRAISDTFEAVLLRHILPFWFWRLQKRLGLGKERKLSEARETLDEIATYFASEKRKQIQNGTSDNSDFSFLKLYLIRHKLFEKFAEDETLLRQNFYSLLFAAEDTTSTTLTWFFWLLGNHPIVEAKIIEELRMWWPKGQSVLEFGAEEVKKMVYLHAAVCETLRLYPPVAFECRSAVRPEILPSGHHVGRKSTLVVLATYAIGRMKHVWGEDCQEFKPERWITAEGGIKYEPPHKFFAFNAGQKMCPGKDIAFNLIKAAAGNILYNYRVKIEQDHPISLKNSILHQMNGGLMAKIEKRE